MGEQFTFILECNLPKTNAWMCAFMKINYFPVMEKVFELSTLIGKGKSNIVLCNPTIIFCKWCYPSSLYFHFRYFMRLEVWFVVDALSLVFEWVTAFIEAKFWQSFVNKIILYSLNIFPMIWGVLFREICNENELFVSLYSFLSNT